MKCIIVVLIFFNFSSAHGQNANLLENDSICKLCIKKEYYQNKTIKKITYSSISDRHLIVLNGKFEIFYFDEKGFLEKYVETSRTNSRMGSCGELNIDNSYIFENNKLLKTERKVNSEIAAACYGYSPKFFNFSKPTVSHRKNKKLQIEIAKQKLESEKLFTDKLYKRIKLLMQ